MKRFFCRWFHYWHRELIEPGNFGRPDYIKCHACKGTAKTAARDGSELFWERRHRFWRIALLLSRKAT